MVSKKLTFCTLLGVLLVLTKADKVSNGHSNLPFGWRLIKINRKLVNSTNLQSSSEIDVSVLKTEGLKQKDSTSEPLMDTEIDYDENFLLKDHKESVNEQSRRNETTKAHHTFEASTTNVYTLEESEDETKKSSIKHTDTSFNNLLNHQFNTNVHFPEGMVKKYFLPAPNRVDDDFRAIEQSAQKDIHLTKDILNRHLPTLNSFHNFVWPTLQQNTSFNINNFDRKVNSSKHVIVDQTNVDLKEAILNRYFLPKPGHLDNFITPIGLEENFLPKPVFFDNFNAQTEHQNTIFNENTNSKPTIVQVAPKNDRDLEEDIINKYFLPRPVNVNYFIPPNEGEAVSVNDNNHHIKKIALKQDQGKTDLKKVILNTFFLPKPVAVYNFSSLTGKDAAAKHTTQIILKENQSNIKLIPNPFDMNNFISSTEEQHVPPNNNDHNINNNGPKVVRVQQGNKDLKTDILSKYFLPKAAFVSNFSSPAVQQSASLDINNHDRKSTSLKHIGIQVNPKEDQSNTDLKEDDFNKYFLPKPVDFNSEDISFDNNNYADSKDVISENNEDLKEDVLNEYFLPKLSSFSSFTSASQLQNALSDNNNHDRIKIGSSHAVVKFGKEQIKTDLNKNIPKKFFLPTAISFSNFASPVENDQQITTDSKPKSQFTEEQVDEDVLNRYFLPEKLDVDRFIWKPKVYNTQNESLSVKNEPLKNKPNLKDDFKSIPNQGNRPIQHEIGVSTFSSEQNQNSAKEFHLDTKLDNPITKSDKIFLPNNINCKFHYPPRQDFFRPFHHYQRMHTNHLGIMMMSPSSFFHKMRRRVFGQYR